MQRTCVIIKPDGVCKKLIGKIITRFEEEGCKLVAMKMVKPERKQLEKFYEVHRGRDYYKPFIDFMTSAPIIVAVFESENAVKKVREIIGETDSRKAASGSLRAMFGSDDRRNLVHASDSEESARSEIGFFFTPEEIFNYNQNAWKPKT